MIAVDTNVLVRLLTADDPTQGPAARDLFDSGPVWIAKTVFLETAWVLRSLYGFDERAICDSFATLLGLKNVHAEDDSALAAALSLTRHGIELADAMHVSSRPPGVRFFSFDKSFVARARRAGVSDVSSVVARED